MTTARTKPQPFCGIHAEQNKQNTEHGQAMLNVPSERTYRMGASWPGPLCLQDEAQNFALPAKTQSEGK